MNYISVFPNKRRNGMDDVSRQMNINLTTISEPVVRWFETYSRCQREMAEEVSRFMTERLRRNVETFGAITQSGNPASVFEVQEHWISTCVRDYTNESQKLASLSGEIVQTYLSGMQAARPDMDKPVAIRSTR